MPNSKHHKIWRSKAKKHRRRKIRQQLAIMRDQLLTKDNPTPTPTLDDALDSEEESRVSELNNNLWLAREKEAQHLFEKARRKKEEAERVTELERQRIKATYDAQIQKQKDLIDAKKRAIKEEQERARQLAEQVNDYVQGHIELLPVELTMASETNPGRDLCNFFAKTGACRFGNSCSKNHIRPGVSRMLLVANFFSNISLEQRRNTEYGNDISLETEDHELRELFEDFYHDVVPELESFGKLDQFQVCQNGLPHLRGNVYVQYEQQRCSIRAYQALQGRYYAGRRLNLEFCSINSLSAAICGLFSKNRCPKGSGCNFLHVFTNPNNRFLVSGDRVEQPLEVAKLKNQQHQVQSKKRQNACNSSWDDEDTTTSKRNWRWSESPEPSKYDDSRKSPSTTKRHHKSRSSPAPSNRHGKKSRKTRKR